MSDKRKRYDNVEIEVTVVIFSKRHHHDERMIVQEERVAGRTGVNLDEIAVDLNEIISNVRQLAADGIAVQFARDVLDAEAETPPPEPPEGAGF